MILSKHAILSVSLSIDKKNARGGKNIYDVDRWNRGGSVDISSRRKFAGSSKRDGRGSYRDN